MFQKKTASRRPMDTDSVEQEIVCLIANQCKSVPLPLIMALALLAVIALTRIPVSVVASWLCVTAVVMVLRYRLLVSLPERLDLSPVQKLKLVVRSNLFSGLTHAAALGAFPFLSEPERAFFSVLLMGLCTGTVATSAGYRPALQAYIVPVMGCLGLMWALSPGVAQPSLIERVIALLIVFYWAVLVGLAREVNRGIVDSWAIRLRERDLNLKLQGALDVAENASRAKTRFLAAASHDLRQPLHTITMLGAALSMRTIDERSQQIVTLLNEVTQSFSDQLDGLLDISKLDAGIVSAERKPVQIAALLAQHMAEITSLIEARQLTPLLICRTQDHAETDPQLFLRVLRNLTHNAIKFTDAGSITLEVRRCNASIEVVVSDTGRGIPNDQQSHVFQEFYQVGNPERDRAQGLGLGLSIVRRLVDLLGIDMQMHSIAAQGTRFVLRLPAADVATSYAQEQAGESLEQVFSLCVLVIDDEKNVRTSLQILLEELGCTCLDAAGTEQALQKVKHVRPDLVLADFRLRGTDSGLNAIAAVNERWPGVPAVLVSGDTAPGRLQEAQHAGIRLLHKPLPIEVLKQELIAASRAK